MKAERQAFEAQQAQVCAEEVIAMDERGIVTGMSRAYGYAPRGQRAVSAELAAKGTRLRVVGALTVDGFLGGLDVTGTVNGDVFEAFIEQVVLPHLRPGKLVLLANATCHQCEEIQTMSEATGARVLFLPRYSPEYNPIERCWSTLKAWIRNWSPATVAILQRALTQAIQQVSTRDAEGWFRHAGFLINANA